MSRISPFRTLLPACSPASFAHPFWGKLYGIYGTQHFYGLKPNDKPTNSAQRKFAFHCFPHPSNNKLSISSHNYKIYTPSLYNLQRQNDEKRKPNILAIQRTQNTKQIVFCNMREVFKHFRTKIYIQHTYTNNQT